MPAEPGTTAAQARDRYVDEFRQFLGNGAAGAPPWLAELRQRAIQRFADVGFPSTQEEAWRFTDVSRIVRTPFAFPRDGAPAGSPVASLDGLLLGGGAVGRLVFIDGRFEPAASVVRGLPPGVRFESLRSALTGSPELIQRHLGRYAAIEENTFTALGTAFVSDGAFLFLPEGARLATPLQVLFVASGDRPQVTFPRTLVVLEAGAEAALLETYGSVGRGPYLTNAVTEVALGNGGRLDYCRLQHESAAAYHFGVTQSLLGRDARLESCAIALGGSLARHDIGAVLDGEGGSLILNGLTLAGDHQHVDHHTVIDHARPHCESHELFNGVFDDHARGVFTGRIIVRPGAQRTDSKQTNNNLLLSEDARADSQPQLEIYADDVKCTHGATLGPIDEAVLFYLRSRGLGREEARNLLTYGFGADIVSRVRAEALRNHLYPLLLERLCRQRTGALAA